MENLLKINTTVENIESSMQDKMNFLDELDNQRDIYFKAKADKQKIRTTNYRDYYQICKYGFETTKIARTFLSILVEWNKIKGEMDKAYKSENWIEFGKQYGLMNKLMEDAKLKQASSYLNRMHTSWINDSSLKKDLRARISTMFDTLASARKLYRKNI